MSTPCRDANPATAATAALIPAHAGSYALWLVAAQRRRLTIGSLGALAVQPGFYVYTGSAHGPGGLRARLRHHLGRTHRLHWHVDYLRRATQPVEIWCSDDNAVSEHAWSALFAATAGASSPLRGFGASDCDCPSHLFHFSRMPDHAALAAQLRAATRARRPFLRFSAKEAVLPVAAPVPRA
jgi:Uri superfamily endonuclease